MYNKLKELSLTARRCRHATAPVLITLISDVDAMTLAARKKDPEMVPADVIVIAIIKKHMKGVSETIDILHKNGGDPEALSDKVAERNFLQFLLPEAITGDALRTKIESVFTGNMSTMGALKSLSASEGFDFDGGEAALILKAML